MKVLITNFALARPRGTESFVVDLARSLLRRGHEPRVYSPRAGALAEELRATGVPVVDDLARVEETPDVLHLQHHVEAMTAIARFPGVPAIFVCHGFRPWQETPPIHPQIVFYAAVDLATRERLEVENSIAPERVRMIPNSVDMVRFRPRAPLGPKPRRALALSNELDETNGLMEIRAACSAHGIELEAAGIACGRPLAHPERELHRFDLVFGHGRVALEALAVGTSVVVCGVEGLGPLVRPENFDWLRERNFGFRTQARPLVAKAIEAEIAGFDPAEAAAVSARVRLESTLDRSVQKWIELYESARAAGTPDAGTRPLASYLRWLGEQVEGNLVAVENRASETRRAEEKYEQLLAQAVSESAARASAERELAAARSRLDELERFHAAVVSSRPWKGLEAMRGIFGRRWGAEIRAAAGSRTRFIALLVFRDEMEFLPGWFENVPPEVDGVVALDDGSSDGSYDYVARQPSVLEVVRLPRREEREWDDGANHRRVTEAALRHRPDWLLGVDADERLESGFGARARDLIERAGAAGPGGYYVGIRDLWDQPDRFRSDGVWGAKRSARMFRARADHEFDPRRLHGVWAPLNSRENGDYPLADLLVYHLRMLTPERRRRRRERYERLDPDAAFQQIGYAYLTDESQLELAELPRGRGYRPLGR